MMALFRKGHQKSFAFAMFQRTPAGVGFVRLLVLAVLGVAGSVAAFALAVSGIARLKAPERALAFVPWEGDALATKADLMLLSGQSGKVAPRKIAALGFAARRNAPLNAKAVRLIGMSAGLEGKQDKAEKLMVGAATLTRRDAITQVFLVEAAARDNDLRAALRHYDIALRASPAAQQILFPRLQKAIRDPRVRGELKPYVRDGASWTEAFFGYVRYSGQSVTSLVDLIIETGGHPDSEKASQQKAALLQSLFDQQNYADLQRLLRHVPGATPALLTTAGLESLDRREAYGPAAWQLLDDADAGASVVRDGNNRPASLAVFANSGTTRPVAQKLLALRPGRYRLSFQVTSTTPGEGRSVGWLLRCIDPAKAAPLWRLDAARRSETTEIVVGSGCRVQLLQLLASGGGGQTGLEAVVSDVALIPANGKAVSAREERDGDKRI